MTPLQDPSQAAGGVSDTIENDYAEDMPAGNVQAQLPGLYAQALATREQSRLLAAQLRESQRRAMENWQLIQLTWERTHEIRALRVATSSDKDRLRYSAYARMQAKLASLPVIEQAKGIIMAQCGWPEDQAFDALRRASQRENVKLRDVAARVVAAAVASAPAAKQSGRAPASTRSPGRPSSAVALGSSKERRRASA
jgi:hypothetical protein